MQNQTTRIATGIIKRGKSYYFTVSLGYNQEHKQIRKTYTYHPPEGVSLSHANHLAKEAYYQFKNRCKGNQYCNLSKYNFSAKENIAVYNKDNQVIYYGIVAWKAYRYAGKKLDKVNETKPQPIIVILNNDQTHYGIETMYYPDNSLSAEDIIKSFPSEKQEAMSTKIIQAEKKLNKAIKKQYNRFCKKYL